MTETGTALEVIFGRCEKTATGCWEYVKGYHLREGYGQLTYEGKQQPTHRIVWQETNGPIPDGMVVCHSCDNPPCCNPEHLWLGTVGDNNRDRESKGRSAANLVPGAGAQAQRNKTHCKHGHEFTEDNTYRDGRGGRRCRACARRAEQTRKPRSGALKVSPQMLEAMWGIAAAQGKDSALEVGHPTKDVLRVDGKTVAWSAKQTKPTEPQGLGAVVEDTRGEFWVRKGKTEHGEDWARQIGNAWTGGGWDRIDVVRVLSEGVTA